MSQRDEGAACFSGLVDLAARVLGGRALSASDEFFAEKENLLAPGRGVFLPDEYTDRGKWMDGWESRRKRVPGHDWCIVKLGVPGVVRGVDIDCNHFLGNHPPFASVDACNVPGDPSAETLRDATEWREILPEVALRAGSQNVFAVEPGRYSHLRLNILPDGGVARLRVYGEPQPIAGGGGVVDLACASSGGRPIGCSDMFFSPMGNLILPERATNMGGGWETRRRRGPGHDWIVVALGAPGVIERIEIDTAFFKGNYPDRASVDGIAWPEAPASLLLRSDGWRTLLAESKLGPDRVHGFELPAAGPVTHLRLNVHPCGGVSRLRAFGRPEALDPGGDQLLTKLNGLDEAAATGALSRACGSQRWVRAIVARRPFASRAQLFGTAEHVWWRLGDGDWREAFSHHPEIGGDVAKLRERFAATADWSKREQSGVAAASEETLERLAAGNRRYWKRFGFLFIVCASGKSADEMVGLLEARLDNTPENELRIAAGEQAKITRLRLEKLEHS